MGEVGAMRHLKTMYSEHSYLTIMLIAASLFFIELFFVLLVEPFGDVINFYNQAEMVKDGMLPYADFVFEFPPFAMLFFLIPSIFTSDQNTYAYLFGIMMVLMALVCLYCLMKIADKIGINKALVAGVFVALILIYEGDIVRKFDAIPMVLTTMSVFYYMDRRTPLAYAISVFAAFVKIYPIILTALFFVLDLADRRDSRPRRIMCNLASCIAVALLAIVPLLAMGISFSETMSFLTFQGERGFQVESLVGVIIQGLGILGLVEYSIVPMYNTWDVVGPLADALSAHWNLLVMAILIILLLLVAIRAFRVGGNGTSPRDLTLYALLLIGSFVILNKVFSTQYMLWLFPLLALLPVSRLPNVDRRLLYAVILVDLLSMVMFALYNPGNVEFVAVNLLRDVIVIALLISVLIYVLGRGGKLSQLYEGESENGSPDGTGGVKR